VIDHQSEFRQKVILLLLIILLLPLLFIFYFGQKSATNVQETQPILITNSKTLHLRGTIRDIKLSKNSKYAYVVANSRGVYIIDVQNPLEPKLVSQFKYFKNSYDKSRSIELAEEKNILFIRDAQAGIYSINIENISEPKLLTTHKQQEQIYQFVVSENEEYIYLCDESGIKVLDIKNPDAIQTVASYDTEKRYIDIVEVKENLLYLLSSHDIDILDTSHDQELKLVGNYIALGDAEKIVLSSNKTRAFLSSGYNGVEILDIANKLNPKPLGIYKSTKTAKNTLVSKDGKTLFISNLKDVVEIADIKNPDNAKHLRTLNVNNATKAKALDVGLSLDENVLFIANGIGGVKVLGLK
jgi:hypothetical protein